MKECKGLLYLQDIKMLKKDQIKEFLSPLKGQLFLSHLFRGANLSECRKFPGRKNHRQFHRSLYHSHSDTLLFYQPILRLS